MFVLHILVTVQHICPMCSARTPSGDQLRVTLQKNFPLGFKERKQGSKEGLKATQ